METAIMILVTGIAMYFMSSVMFKVIFLADRLSKRFA